MAGTDEHDESFQQINDRRVMVDNNDSVNETDVAGVINALDSAESSNEILLYVDGNQEGVHDLIRVALNQGITSNELQQQLQNAGANITLQSLGDAQTVISLQEVRNLSADQSSGVLNIQSNQQNANDEGGEAEGDCQLVIGKDTDMNNLFQLANLSGALSSEAVKGTPIEGQIESEIQNNMTVVKTEMPSTSDSTVIEDYIIATIDSKDTEKVPGEFNVGDAFYSLEEVEEALHSYEEKHDVKLYKRDVRSLEALLKRSLKLQKLDNINESLKYGQLLYCCVYGGKRKAQKMACMDESGIARYTDCKMFIRFAISDDGMKLVVNGKLETHNHEEVQSDEQNMEPRYITNAGNADEIRLGAGFVDLEELYKAIHKYETDNHVHLWRRDGRTVEALAKRAPGTARKILETNPGLRFAELRFCCSYGGRHLSDGQKDKLKAAPGSFKQGCEMHIRFGVSDDGSQLVVKSMSEEHNHEINEESVVKEALHPELCSFVSKLVWSDTNIGIDEVKKQLENYVCNEMFKDQVTPPRTRRQYFPSKKQIRYFMAKAKASLHISQDTELKLAAQAEKLKEAHSDEKMIFNFKIKHDVNPLDFGVHQEESVGDNEETFLPAKVEGQTEGNLHENAKVLFCHQTPHQQRLLKRYNAQLILTQVNDIYSKIPFPLFCLYVQTNVDFQLVGEFIIQNNTTDMIAEGFQTIKEWNPGWNPKFVIVDYSEEQIHAVENAFPGAFLLISDASREQAWMDWLSNEENGVSEHKDDVLKYLQAIANSYSEDTLNTAARELEESEVWKMSDKMRNWFQIHWLSQAKRWVAGYRPDDYLLTSHTGRTLEDELKVFKSIKLVSKSAPLQDVIQQLVEHVVPVTTKQYELLNQESFKLQNELLYSYPDIPNYLSSRPGKLTYHIYERIKLAAEQSYVISYLHPGIFTVQGRSSDDDLLHTVSFGDASSYPSCDCLDWQQYKVPCCHLCSVFSNYPGWTWDMLTLAYKNAPVLSVDWSALSGDEGKEVPGFRIDNSTQTTGASLLGSATDIAKHNRMGDARISETPQVLATQCRALLQQLSKLQLAQHSRENLHRLKSELKDLISVFSSAPKQKHPLSSPGLTGSFVIQNKAGRTRKINLATSTQQSVFEQYNVKPITPKQVISPSNAERTSYATRSRTGSDTNTSKIDDSHAGNSHAVTAENLLTKTIYVVDPAHVLATSAKKVSEEIDNTPVAKVTTRKRAEHVSVFTKPLEKRSKVDGETDKGQTEQVFQRSESLEFSEEPAANLLAASNTATESPMIDCQTISHISLDVSDAISDGLTANDVQMSFANTLQTLTVTALPQSVTYQQEPNTGTNEDSNIEESVVK